MTFTTVNVNRDQLQQLNQLLITVFPGCTIHQNRDPMRAIQHLSNQKIDAIFADAETCSDWLPILGNHKSKPVVYLLCRQEAQPAEVTEQVHGIVTYPITKFKIQNALQTMGCW